MSEGSVEIIDEYGDGSGGTESESAEKPVDEKTASPVSTGTGNTIGVITQQSKASNVQAKEANPEAASETPKEEGFFAALMAWFTKGIEGIPDAIEHPEMAASGAGKSLWNMALDAGSLLTQGAAYKASGEMMQSAVVVNATGNTAQANEMMESAHDVSNNAGSINFDRAKGTLNTPAEHTGDVAVQSAMTILDGAGLFKGLNALLSKSALKDAAKTAAKNADAAGPGGTIPPRKVEGVPGKNAADEHSHPSKSDKKEGEDIDTTLCMSDPVDVATGDFLQVLPVIDLPGTLPLTLNRVYRSRSRAQGIFGRKWADNWSQLLVLDESEIHFTNHEGTKLSYYASGEEVDALNLYQAHCRLYGTRSGPLYVYNRKTQLTLCFEPQPQAYRRLSSVRDNAGNVFHLGYEGERLIRVDHSDGWHLELEYQLTRLTRIIRVDGQQRQWLVMSAYDDKGLLSECKTFQFTHLWHEYDVEGHMTRWRDTDKTDVRYRYDQKGRVVAVRAEGDYYCDRFIYDEINRRTTYINGEGGCSRFEYNCAGLVTQVTDPLGRITRTLWDHGNKVRETDPLGRQTHWYYNDFGQVTAVVKATGDKVCYDYNDAGQVSKLTQPDGKYWLFNWNAQGCLIGRTDPQGLVYQREYDTQGKLVRDRQPDGTTWRFKYNAQHQLSTLIAPDDAITVLTQDSFGRLTTVTDPLGNQTRHLQSQEHANPEGSTIGIHLPDDVSQSVRYDGEKRRASITDGEGKTTRYVYGAFDLLLALTRPDGQTLRFGYDSLIRLNQVTCATGEIYRFERDAAGQVIRETDFTGRTIHYSYDVAGRRISARHPDKRLVRWQYSLRDELLRQDVWQCEDLQSTLLGTTHYAYDAQGRIVRAQNDDAVVAFLFDEAGRLIG